MLKFAQHTLGWSVPIVSLEKISLKSRAEKAAFAGLEDSLESSGLPNNTHPSVCSLIEGPLYLGTKKSCKE